MKTNFPTLSTPRFELRQFTQADLENVFKGLSHPEVIKYYGIHFNSLEATQEQIDWYANLEKTETGIWWAIWEITSNIFCGGGGFNDLSKEHRKAELGFWLLPESWGKGIMQETMPVILNHAFTALNLHRIEGYVESSNENCKRAMKRLDFVHEGTMKDCEIKDGQFISVDIYAKFKQQ